MGLGVFLDLLDKHVGARDQHLIRNRGRTRCWASFDHRDCINFRLRRHIEQFFLKGFHKDFSEG
jgi:hypothetical protein